MKQLKENQHIPGPWRHSSSQRFGVLRNEAQMVVVPGHASIIALCMRWACHAGPQEAKLPSNPYTTDVPGPGQPARSPSFET